ncbi:MAG: hypothetical protein PHX93_03890 [Candidatus Peribacteraceae bacterium]|jgi:hypothetical protein|nr:hypothetical protein [Candidatus Peribacteraceae bacterium]
MPALRIQIVPLEQAVNNQPTFNETLLKAMLATIVQQRIEGLSRYSSHRMQCALWVSGTKEGIDQLTTYLDGQQMYHERMEQDLSDKTSIPIGHDGRGSDEDTVDRI